MSCYGQCLIIFWSEIYVFQADRCLYMTSSCFANTCANIKAYNSICGSALKFRYNMAWYKAVCIDQWLYFLPPCELERTFVNLWESKRRREKITQAGEIKSAAIARAGTGNYIAQIPWGVITCACHWYQQLVSEAGNKGGDKKLYPTDTVSCNYLCLPLIHGTCVPEVYNKGREK